MLCWRESKKGGTVLASEGWMAACGWGVCCFDLFRECKKVVIRQLVRSLERFRERWRDKDEEEEEEKEKVIVIVVVRGHENREDRRREGEDVE